MQVARSKQQPDLQVQSIVNYDMGTDDFFAGFQVNIPWMTNDRKLGGIAAARAQVHSTTEKLNQTKLALIRRMTELSIEIDNLKRRISSVESRTLPLVERNLAETMAVFRAGEASYIAVRDAIDLKFETRRQLNADTKSLLLGAIQLENGDRRIVCDNLISESFCGFCPCESPDAFAFLKLCIRKRPSRLINWLV